MIDETIGVSDALLVEEQGLLVATAMWARRRPVDHDAIGRAQDRAVLLLHRHYRAAIPVYRQIADRQHVGDLTDVLTVTRELLVTGEVFKAYDPDWLDDGDFTSMTRWLRTVFVRDPHSSVADVDTLPEWRAALRSDGVFLTWSSGTSGRLSFVPRDRATLTALRRNGELIEVAPRREAACLVLTQRGLGLGIQSVAHGLVTRAAGRAHHLDHPGPKAPPSAIDEAWERAIGFLAECVRHRQVVAVLGSPAMVHELCARVDGTSLLDLPEGSSVVTGGGWKVATPIAPGDLRARIGEALGVAPEHAIDVYGAAELNCYLVRCPAGRYHIPPLVRAVVLDESLTPIGGDDAVGLLGFLDLFARSYPGFVIPGDIGRLVAHPCACGLDGWAIAGPIERAPDYGVRGCATVGPGGVLAGGSA